MLATLAKMDILQLTWQFVQYLLIKLPQKLLLRPIDWHPSTTVITRELLMHCRESQWTNIQQYQCWKQVHCRRIWTFRSRYTYKVRLFVAILGATVHIAQTFFKFWIEKVIASNFLWCRLAITLNVHRFEASSDDNLLSCSHHKCYMPEPQT